MDGLTYAILQDVVGWLLWFALTHMLTSTDSKKRGGWVTIDYYISTTLLALSTLCTVFAVLLGRPALLWGVAIPALIVGLSILAVRAMRQQARGRVASYTSDAQTGTSSQWSVRTAPRSGARPAAKRTLARASRDLLLDPLIRDIEARRMPA